jgi:hypothetical protein
MSEWNEGYVSDIDYTYGYYPELNPLRARLAFLSAGYAPPQLGVHCELGFGQGMSINIHASASSTKWVGTDFNPSQAAFAQSIANSTGNAASLTDEAFEAFCTRTDLPEFDSIGLHGIWSWISDSNRAVIVEFIRTKLKVGGVVYISYNTLPGWAAFAPMRHLLTQHAELMGRPGEGIVNRIGGALDFADQLMAVNPAYAKANPQVAERLNRIKGQNKHYLAHEYFNRDWHPMHFSSMAEWLKPAKLSYACSAHFMDHVDAVNLSAEQQALLKSIPDVYLRESVRDFVVNQQFRKDYWVKGGIKLQGAELTEAIYKEEIILVAPKSSIGLKVKAAIGEVTLSEKVYQPLLEILGDYQSHTLGELIKLVQPKGVVPGQVFQAVMVLCGVGYCMPSQGKDKALANQQMAHKLNALILGKARVKGDVGYLASPVTGGGISVGRFQQLFMLAHQDNCKDAGAMAKYVWQILNGQGQKMLKAGEPLNSEAENLAELQSLAKDFIEQQLPVIQALMLA